MPAESFINSSYLNWFKFRINLNDCNFHKLINMGNQNYKKQGQPHELQDQKIGHEKFQHYKYLENEDLIEIVVDSKSDKQIFNWEKDLKLVDTFQDKEALLIANRHIYQPQGFCGTAGCLKLYFDNYPYLFSQQIDNRISMSKHFQQEQLWYLLFSLVSCAKDFSKIDKKIGDVRPSNIFINEDGQIKIANAFSWPQERNNFDKTVFEKQLTYLSPEEMALVTKGNHENKTNKVLSQSFSIGLTMLEAGLLVNVKQLYIMEWNTFDIKKLQKWLNDWLNIQFINEENNVQQTYSNLLKKMIFALCQPQIDRRATSLNIQSILRPFQNQILHLKEFDHQDIFFQIENIQNRPIQQVGQPIIINQDPRQQYEQSYVNKFVSQPQQIIVPQPQIYRPIPPNQIYPSESSYQKVVNGRVESQIPDNLKVKYGSNVAVPVRFVGQPQVRPQTQYFSEPTNERPYHQYFNQYAVNNTNIQPVQLPSIPVNTMHDQFHKYSTGNQPPFSASSSGAGNFQFKPTGNITNLPNNFNTTSNNTFSNPSNNTFNTTPNNTFSNPSNISFKPQNNTFTLPQNNTFNIPSYNTNNNSQNNTFNIPNTTSIYQPNPLPSIPQQNTFTFQKTFQSPPVSSITRPYPSVNGDPSNDFLKKIDEQLQNSRKQFPSI